MYITPSYASSTVAQAVASSDLRSFECNLSANLVNAITKYFTKSQPDLHSPQLRLQTLLTTVLLQRCNQGSHLLYSSSHVTPLVLSEGVVTVTMLSWLLRYHGYYVVMP